MPANGHAIYTTDEQVIKALFSTGGNIKATAKALKLSDVINLRKRINNDPVLKEARQEAMEQVLDIAEEVVVKGLKTGSQKSKQEMAKWLLPRKGRNRGYGDVVRTENLNLNANYDLSKMSLEERLKLLETINGARVDRADNG